MLHGKTKIPASTLAQTCFWIPVHPTQHAANVARKVLQVVLSLARPPYNPQKMQEQSVLFVQTMVESVARCQLCQYPIVPIQPLMIEVVEYEKQWTPILILVSLAVLG